MPALSFPASPTVGQTYSANGRTWSWTGYAWELVAASASDSRWDLFLPAAPTDLTATGGNAQASLSWTAPTGVIAQAPITDYREQYSSDNGSTWTTFTAAASTATSATVTGLTNGTSYRFRVAAVNGVGVGAFTTASSAVTPIAGTPPNAPTSLTATAGNAQIALAWTAPSAPGTYAITSYTVEYTPSGGSAQTVSTGSTGTSYTLAGLTNGTAYTVRVAGVSAAGTGTFTAASSSVTPSSAALVKLAGDYTGLGTQASPYTGSTVAYPLFRADVAGTIYYSAGGYNQFGDYGASELRVNGAVVTGAVTYEQGEGLGFAGNRAVAVGDVIGLGGTNWASASFSIHLRT